MDFKTSNTYNVGHISKLQIHTMFFVDNIGMDLILWWKLAIQGHFVFLSLKQLCLFVVLCYPLDVSIWNFGIWTTFTIITWNILIYDIKILCSFFACLWQCSYLPTLHWVGSNWSSIRILLDISAHHYFRGLRVETSCDTLQIAWVCACGFLFHFSLSNQFSH